MSNTLGIIIAGIVIIVLVIILTKRNGPIVAEGWEDPKTGFHYGKHP